MARVSLDRRRGSEAGRRGRRESHARGRESELGLHRALTPDDYAKHNLPYLFDTELHSTCPNDGAELQVQNMTVMPNLRLSEQDARDIASYLFSLSPQPAG